MNSFQDYFVIAKVVGNFLCRYCDKSFLFAFNKIKMSQLLLDQTIIKNGNVNLNLQMKIYYVHVQITVFKSYKEFNHSKLKEIVNYREYTYLHCKRDVFY